MELSPRTWRFWGVVLGGCTLIGLAEATQLRAGSLATGNPASWSRALSATMPSWYVLAALLPGVFRLAREFRLERGRLARSIPVHATASVLFVIVHLSVASWVSDYLLYRGTFPLTYSDNLARLFTMYFVLDVFYYWGILGAFYALDYGGKVHEHQRVAAELALRASRLEASLAHANLETLRMQLNPHFLFNTLNSISVLAMKGQRQAVSRMLTRLSDLLRITLENESQVVPFSEELAFLEPYIEIEKVRFGDRLRVTLDIGAETHDAEVPSLLLQPLVENAIRHGIATRPGPGEVTVRARAEGPILRIEVLDTGPGFQVGAPPAGAGLGLGNTRARLEQLYGDDHRLERSNRPDGGARVLVEIPSRAAGAESTGRRTA